MLSGRFFSNFVAFSEYLNFILKYEGSENLKSKSSCSHILQKAIIIIGAAVFTPVPDPELFYEV